MTCMASCSREQRKKKPNPESGVMSRLVIAAAGPGAERWADSSGSSRIVLDYVVLLLFLHGAHGPMMAWSWCMKRAVVAGLDWANARERRYKFGCIGCWEWQSRFTFQAPASSLISVGLSTSHANGPWILAPEVQLVDSQRPRLLRISADHGQGPS